MNDEFEFAGFNTMTTMFIKYCHGYSFKFSRADKEAIKLKSSNNMSLYTVLFKDDVHSVLPISSAHNKWGSPDINITQILYLSKYSEPVKC